MILPYPLTPANRIRLARAFHGVRRVDLGIDSVLEGQMGRAFVDHLDSPTVFALDHSAFFSYLAGNAQGDAARDLLAGLSPNRLLMPSAPGWIESARTLFGSHLVRLPRTSFGGEALDTARLDGLLAASRFRDRIARIDRPLAARILDEPGHFFEIDAYESVDDFCERGIGYALLARGKCAGAAWAELVCSRGIEISIYVAPDYRHQGVATGLGAALVKWCLENNVDPHWDAANLESGRLATGLGYVRRETYDSYYLAPEGEG